MIPLLFFIQIFIQILHHSVVVDSVRTGEFGGEVACGGSFASDSALCVLSSSSCSVLEEFSSLCLRSSNIRRRRSSWVILTGVYSARA